MFLEINDLEDMVRGNKDFKQLEELMDESIHFHKSSFNQLLRIE